MSSTLTSSSSSSALPSSSKGNSLQTNVHAQNITDETWNALEWRFFLCVCPRKGNSSLYLTHPSNEIHTQELGTYPEQYSAAPGSSWGWDAKGTSVMEGEGRESYPYPNNLLLVQHLFSHNPTFLVGDTVCAPHYKNHMLCQQCLTLV